MSDVRIFKVGKGEEVIEALNCQLAEAGIQTGAVVALIGAVEGCSISNMPRDDASSDIITRYEQPLEMSGTGEINDGKVHLHTTLSGEGDVARHGHLHRAFVRTWYVAAYVQPIP